MIEKGSVVKTTHVVDSRGAFWRPDLDRLLVVIGSEEVFGGLFIVEAKELGKIETPVERYWDWALEEIPV